MAGGLLVRDLESDVTRIPAWGTASTAIHTLQAYLDEGKQFVKNARIPNKYL